MKTKIFFLALLGCMSFGGTAQASPQLFGSNYYEYIEADPTFSFNTTWASASSAASSSVFGGVNGHLATVTSQAENDFLLSLAGGGSRYAGFTGAWLGGKSPEGWLVGSEAGQAFTYTNWPVTEPNNAGFAYMNVGNGFYAPGQWADDSGVQGAPDGADPVIGYFVEYESAAPIPEPETYAMMLAGLGLLGYATRRKSKSAGNAA